MSYERYKKYNGKSISELSKETGIKAGTLQYRLSHGWSLEDAISKAILTPQEAAKKHDYIGKTFTNRLGYTFIVTGTAFVDKYNVSHYNIKFINSGFETTATGGQILGTSGSPIKDILSPSVFNVGILGYAKGVDDPKIFDVWRAMIARCYNPKNPNYKTYGAKGFSVCERWLRFDYFLNDIKYLPGYNKELINEGKLVLDKDIIDREKKIYSPETCCFVTKSENAKEVNLRRWKSKV